MLSTCLDIFEARLPEKNVGQDFGLLQAIDERLAMYGWMTNTGVKFVIIVDMEGRQSSMNDSKSSPFLGLKNSDLTPVSCVWPLRRRNNCSCVSKRHFKLCKEHTSICSGTLSTHQRITHRLESMPITLSRPLKSPAVTSSTKSTGSVESGLLLLLPADLGMKPTAIRAGRLL